MAFERTFQNFAGRWAPPRGAESENTGGDTARQPGGSSPSARGEVSKNEWSIILEQASELNDELCRENCELHREVSVLRDRRTKRLAAADVSANGAARNAAVNAAWAKEIIPRVTSHVRRSLQQLAEKNRNAILQRDKELLQILEDTVRNVFVVAGEGVRGSEVALASSEETATLIQEKVMLKEMSLTNQERLLELELTKDKLSGGTQGSQWASRLLSNVLQGSLTEATNAGCGTAAVANDTSVPTIERPPETGAVVGSDHVVVGRKGAILRETVDLDSEKVVTLPPGSHVRILEVSSEDSRRAKVLTLSIAGGFPQATVDATEPDPEAPPPAEASMLPGDISPTNLGADAAHTGWLSVTTKDGKALLRPADSHEAVAPEITRTVVNGNSEAETDGNTQQIASESGGEHQAGVAASTPSSSPLPSGRRDGRRNSCNNEEVAQPDVSFSKDQSTVTVSTDYWLSLRHERQQREQQIRALEMQVAAAQRELQQLVEIRSELRTQRSVALEMRRKGSELQEAAFMSAEEIRSLQILDADLRKELRPEPDPAEKMQAAEDNRRCSDESQQSASAEETIANDVNQQAADEEDMKRALEWRRLLSERETTAHELAYVLRRTEELESVFEDRRIELQAAEKRRDRERRSLLTALRELDWQGGAADNSDTEEGGTSETVEACRSDGSSEVMTTTKYLQRISELEDQYDALQLKLDAVQAREAVLNNLAVVRGEALRYAATAAGTSMEAALVASRTSKVRRSAGLQEYFELVPSNEKHRAELDGLANLLEGLFVENYALRSEVLASSSSTTNAEVVQTSSSQFPSAPTVDLSSFIKTEDDLSDDDDNCRQQGATVSTGRQSVIVERHEDVSPATPRHSECWPDSPRSIPSPRLSLLESFTALDFSDMSVAEA